ncbi:hypothetical protein CQ018_14345 [Arthrobacter sp. MYb227]|uniref:PP2C family protein-serine/threonine phosphatase n=1 Tax=Arthrobacter sp. MYb227 TaxID=1848601 RepID=UPI000CFCEDEE|nr:serine/threonine-protein phosphatase [Arthrobacter sp. MYb227]PQZ91138.1 hypothetical protein CQ018_14345 [Arthrobacter sp. MYb227]
MPHKIRIHGDALTDIGLRRAVNEDAVLSGGSIFAVADGMGGHEAGDLASRLCIQTLAKIAIDPQVTDDEQLPHARDLLTQVERADVAIRSAIGARGGTTLCALALIRCEPGGGNWPAAGTESLPQANPAATPGAHPEANTQEFSATAFSAHLRSQEHQRPHDPAAENFTAPQGIALGALNSARHPAATRTPEPATDVLPYVPPSTSANTPAEAPTGIDELSTPVYLDTSEAQEQLHLMLLNVGDSRGYRLRAGVLTQLTLDHSAVQELIDAGSITEAEARVHPHRNLITRALGAGGNSVPDAQFHALVPGDRYLLCSDGLTGEVEHEAIETILSECRERPTALNRLVEAALASGGRDNISAVIIDVSTDSMPAH